MEYVECGKLRWEINNVVEYISYKKQGGQNNGFGKQIFKRLEGSIINR